MTEPRKSAKVTTRVGDGGTTRTLGGDVVSKGDLVIECTGQVDTLRAQIALLRLEILNADCPDREELGEFLFWLLHCCFVAGSAVSDPGNKHPEFRPVDIGPDHAARVEAEQERLQAGLALPKAFIVSAGNLVAARADVVATQARALERCVVRLPEREANFDEKDLLVFLNRLSDYLFVLARHLDGGNHQTVDYGLL